jgi:quercetin dioxygenase-like cupin family protein
MTSSKQPSRPFVGFVQQQELQWHPWAVSGLPDGVDAKILSEDPGGGAVSLLARFPTGWARPAGHHVSEFEILVLEGELSLGEQTLSGGWFAHLPAGTAQGPMSSAGAQALLFFAGPPDFTSGPGESSAAAQRAAYFKDSQAMPWSPGTVSDLPLRIKHLKRDAESGARSWLVSIGPDADVPWESHSTVEEGYLLEGDYILGECLPDGPKTGRYEPGGYFYRPPHQLHSGPDSGTQGGAVWLMRTPAKLDVEFHSECLPTEPKPDP